MNLKRLGVIDSEAGVLIFADAFSIGLWRGSVNDVDNAKLVNNLLTQEEKGFTITDGGHKINAWDLQGPGTVDVYHREDGNIVLIRVWFSDEYAEDAADAICNAPLVNGTNLGTLPISSGYIAFIDSYEDGSCVYEARDGSYAVDVVQTMTSSSGAVFKVQSGIYICIQDELTLDENEAIRYHLIVNGN